MRLGAIVRWIEIGAAREDDPVEHRERLVDRVLARRDDERAGRPRGSIAFDVDEIGTSAGGLRPRPPGDLLGVRGDADDRLSSALEHPPAVRVYERDDDRVDRAVRNGLLKLFGTQHG